MTKQVKLDEIESLLLKDGFKFTDSYRGAWEYVRGDQLAVVIFHPEEQRSSGITMIGMNILEISADHVTENDLSTALKNMGNSASIV